MIAEPKMKNVGKSDLEACISVNLPSVTSELAINDSNVL